MSEFFAEATVRLRPDLTGFVKELRTQIKAAVEQVETGPQAPKVRIKPALTKNFIGELRRQVNAAVTQAQRGVKPIRVSAVISDFPRGQLREISQRSLTAPVRAGANLRGVAQGAREADKAFSKLFDTQRVLNSSFGQSATLLGSLTAAETATAAARTRTASGIEVVGRTTLQLTAAYKALIQAERAVATVELTAEGTRSRTTAIRRAEFAVLTALVLAEEEHAAAVTSSATALQRRLTLLDANNRALTETAGATARAARSQEQLRRGALATSLSFLGIRGATLAASASFLAGAAAIGVFAKALQNSVEFARQLSVFRATTAATADQMNRVRDAARALGADLTLPGVTAGDAAESMVELAKAGLDVQNSIDGARGVLQLATAAAIDNAQAVELAANALNAFELTGRDATRVADTFANAANAAQGSIVDIGIAFQQASAAGRQVGISFEDTTAFLTLLARAGLRGSDAGTSLRTALLRLVRPTKAATERMKELGIELRDASGNIRPDVFIQITEATREMGPAARDAFISLVGGADAFRAISILGRESIGDFIQLRRELRTQGTAAELAEARMTGLGGAVEGLSNQLSTAGIRIGASMSPALEGVVGGLTGFVASASESAAIAQTLTGIMDSLTLGLQATGATVSALVTVLGPLASGLAFVANSVGIPTILAAVAAYKLLPPIFLRIRTTAAVASTAIALMGLQGVNPLRLAVTAAISSFNLWVAAIAVASAGLLFLITRETAAERATRRLTEATQALAEAQSRRRESAARASDLRLGVNAARLAVLEAQASAQSARNQLQASRAGQGTFQRTKLELQLAVAVDNVRAAQVRLREAIRDTNEAQRVAVQAATNAREAREDEIQTITDLVAVERRSIELRRGGDVPAVRARAEAAAIRDVAAALRERAEALRDDPTPQNLALARRLEILANTSEILNQLPSEKAIEIVIKTESTQQVLRDLIDEFGRTGELSVQELLDRINGTSAKRQLRAGIQDLVNTIESSFSLLMGEAGQTGGQNFSARAALGIKLGAVQVEAAVADLVARAQAQLAGLQRQALSLEIAGAGPQARLANILQQEREARRILEVQERRAAEDSRASISVNRARERLAAIVRERRGIEDEIAQAQQEADDKAKEAADKADEAALGRLERRRERLEARVTDAQQTETLADDIRRTAALRRLVHRQINIIKEVVKDRQAQIEAIRSLQNIEQDLIRSQRQLRIDRRQQILDRQAERNQLDIEFAVLTENVSAEIRFRLREIARLKRLQSLTERGTVEYKRYRNLIEEQRQAIKDARDKAKERNNMFAQLAFQFLTTQQGFAANVLGNLLPGGVAGGAVGGTGPLGGRTTERLQTGGLEERLGIDTGVSAAGQAGPTRGQATVELTLLREIRNILRAIQGGRAHPEHKSTKNRANRSMDYGM